jgi:hypothetical protein
MNIPEGTLELIIFSVTGTKKEKVSSQELTRLLNLKPEEVAKTANSLCEQGFLVRKEEPNPEYPQDPSYNTVYYHLSEKGEELYKGLGEFAERTNLFTNVTSS